MVPHRKHDLMLKSKISEKRQYLVRRYGRVIDLINTKSARGVAYDDHLDPSCFPEKETEVP